MPPHKKYIISIYLKDKAIDIPITILEFKL